MRWLGRILLLCLLLISALVLYQRFMPRLVLAWKSAFPALQANSTPIVMTELSAAREAHWQIPDQARLLRARLALAMHPMTTQNQDTRLVLQIKLLDGSGQVLRAWQEHRLLRPSSTQANRALMVDTQSQFDARVISPLFVDVHAHPDARELSLSLAETNPAIAKVAVRVLDTRERSAEQATMRWRRMSDRRRAELSKISVIPVPLIPPSERPRFALRNLRPLGTEGVMGQDFNEVLLYLRGADAEMSDTEDSIATGLIVMPQKPWSWHAKAGTWRIEWLPMPNSNSDQAPVVVVQGLSNKARDLARAVVAKDGLVQAVTLATAEVLKISSTGAVQVRVQSPDGEDLSLPQGESELYFSPPEQGSLRYPILLNQTRGLRLQVEARQFALNGPLGNASTKKEQPANRKWVRWRALASDDRVIAQGHFEVKSTVAELDRLMTNPLVSTVSVASGLSLPVGARWAAVEVESDVGVMVRVLNGLTNPNTPLFGLQPVAADLLRANRQSLAVLVQAGSDAQRSPETTGNNAQTNPSNASSETRLHPIQLVKSSTVEPARAELSWPDVTGATTQTFWFLQAGQTVQFVTERDSKTLHVQWASLDASGIEFDLLSPSQKKLSPEKITQPRALPLLRASNPVTMARGESRQYALQNSTHLTLRVQRGAGYIRIRQGGGRDE